MLEGLGVNKLPGDTVTAHSDKTSSTLDNRDDHQVLLICRAA
jgi:hypothetical protein